MENIEKKKGCVWLATISPVSDLRNYNTVLEEVSVGSPLYYQDSFTGYYFVIFKAFAGWLKKRKERCKHTN